MAMAYRVLKLSNSGYLTGKQEKVAASVPVVIELSSAETVPGTLTAVLYKTSWM